MLYRLQIALVFVAPVLLLAALYAIGHALGVRAPLLGRGYVIRKQQHGRDEDQRNLQAVQHSWSHGYGCVPGGAKGILLGRAIRLPRLSPDAS